MKYTRELLKELMEAHPKAEIIISVGNNALCGDFNHTIAEPSHIEYAEACWVEQRGFNLIKTRKRYPKQEGGLNQELVLETYTDLCEGHGVGVDIDYTVNQENVEKTMKVISNPEIWSEARKIVSEYVWFEAIIIYAR